MKNLQKLLSLSIFIFSFHVTAENSLKDIKMLMVVYRFPSMSEGFILNQIKLFLDQGVQLDILAEHGSQVNMTQKIVTDYDLTSKVTYINFKKKSNHAILNTLLEAKKYDVVYCQYEGIACYIAPLITQLKNKPLFIAAIQAGKIDEKIMQKKDAYNYCFEHVDYFLPVCNFFRDKFLEFGCSYKKIIVQHTAIDISLFPFKPKKIHKNRSINIVTVARLHSSKGIRYGIEAVAKVHEQYPLITYTIIGGGKDEDYVNEIERVILDLNAQDYITLAGWKTREEIAAIHDNITDIFLLPSIHSEGVPNALMEAMASGIPVISTNHNGIPELVKHGERGLLADVANAEQLAEHIIYMIEHSDYIKKCTKAARKYVIKAHGAVPQNKKLLNVLDSMIQSHRLKNNIT